MRKIAILLTLTMLLASLAGCAGDDDDDGASLVGEWWIAENMTVDFNEDGTLITGEGLSGTWSADGDSFTWSLDNGDDEEVTFSYAVEGDWLWAKDEGDDCAVLSSESISEDEWDDRVSEQTPPSFCESSDGGDEGDADNNANEITAKANVIEALVENSSSDDLVTSAEFTGKLASGSQDTPMNTIQYWMSCERNGDAIYTDSVYFTEERVLTAGENFQFMVEFESCEAASDETITFRIQPDGGGLTMVQLEVSSTTQGASLL